MVLTMTGGDGALTSMTLLAGFPGHATAVGYRVQEDLDYDTYQRLLDHLLTMQYSAGWWLGDLLLQFEGDYGEKYKAALPDRRESEARYQTCRDTKWVADKFEFSRRRENLSFSHHRELAPLKLDEQDLWLDRAEQGKWSVRHLREHLRAAKKPEMTEAPELVEQAGYRPVASMPFDRSEGAELRSLTAPVRSSSAEGMVDEFMSDAGEDESDVEAKRHSEAPHLPSGTMVIPADPDLLASVLGALSGDRVRRGIICPPVQASGRWWCPLGFTMEHDTGTLTVSAVRVLLLERYIEDDYHVHTPAIVADLWAEEVRNFLRQADNYGGLVVLTDPASSRFVLLYERATFRGKLASEAEISPATSIVEDAAVSVAEAETTVTVSHAGQKSAEERDPTPSGAMVEISPEHHRKLMMLVEQSRNFQEAATCTSLLQDMIDTRFEGAGLELAQPEAERIRRENGN
jgi:hypothetical protein